MNYTFNEGQIALFPGQWVDASTHILRDTDSGLSVVITRGPVPEDSDFEKEFHRQWDGMRPQMTSLQQGEFTRVSVGPDNLTRGVEVESHFARNGVDLWQKQLAVPVTDKPQMLLFTFSALRPFSEQDEQHWSQLKASITFTPTEQDA